jgi:hypothetical protein
MAKSAKFDVVVLFTHELRIAAKAVLAAVAMIDDKDVSEDQKLALIKAAIEASYTALNGLQGNKAVMLLDVEHVLAGEMVTPKKKRPKRAESES